MVVDYNILTNDVPLGGRAVADILVTDNGSNQDATTVQVVWKDHNGVTLNDSTYSGSDVNDTDIYGNAVTITNPTGTGTYKATIVVDNNGNYAPSASGLTWSITVTTTTATGSDTEVFTFKIVPTSVDIALDTSSVLAAVKRQCNLTEDVLHVANNTTDTRVDFGRGVVYDIEAAYKNGAAITQGTDYSWSLYQSNTTLLSAPAVNDHYVFRVQRRLSDASIQDYITEATRYVVACLQPYYNDSALATYPTVATLIQDRTIGRIKEDLAEGVAMNSAWYRSGNDLKRGVDDAILMIQRGTMNILDNTGAIVTRRQNGLAGGFRHADGAFTDRLSLVDRAQQHTNLYINMYPSKSIPSKRNL